MRNESITVVIPAYNEVRRILPSLARVDDYLRGEFATYEILVVDDGSSDGTGEAVEKIARSRTRIRLLKNGINRGKGFTVRRGVRSAQGEFIVCTDADLSVPIEGLKDLLAGSEVGADIVIGSRRVKGACIEVRQPRHRILMGRVFNLLVRLLVVDGFTDTQCGFKLLRGAARDLIAACRIDRFCFEVELLFLAKKSGLVVREVPVVWRDSPQTRVRIFADSFNMFLDLFRIRFFWLTGAYRKPLRPDRAA